MPHDSKITRARVGATTTDRNGRVWTIHTKCEHNRGQWYCVTHREFFANQLQKDGHIHVGTHKLAWLCHDCGTLQEP